MCSPLARLLSSRANGTFGFLSAKQRIRNDRHSLHPAHISSFFAVDGNGSAVDFTEGAPNRTNLLVSGRFARDPTINSESLANSSLVWTREFSWREKIRKIDYLRVYRSKNFFVGEIEIDRT